MQKRRVLCYGDSNTWGYCAENDGRFPDELLWPRQLSALLGEEYLVIDEGLCGRTTVFEDSLNEGLSGLSTLSPILRSHSPLSLLILMLGTNDCKERFSVNAQNIADGLGRLAETAKALKVWRDEPRILMVAPIVMDEKLYAIPYIQDEMGRLSVEKSRLLPAKIEECAKKCGCFYLDSNRYVRPNTKDYMHFDFESNGRFAAALSALIPEILR